MSPDKLDVNHLLCQAVEEDIPELIKMALKLGADPSQSIHQNKGSYYEYYVSPAISLAKTLEVAKILVPKPIDFSKIKYIHLVGSHKDVCEYYLSLGLKPDLLTYDYCYDVDRFIQLGVIKKFKDCDKRPSGNMGIRMMELNLEIYWGNLLKYHPNIVDLYLSRDDCPISEIIKTDTEYLFKDDKKYRIVCNHSKFTSELARIFYKHGYEFEHPCQGSMVKNACS